MGKVQGQEQGRGNQTGGFGRPRRIRIRIGWKRVQGAEVNFQKKRGLPGLDRPPGIRRRLGLVQAARPGRQGAEHDREDTEDGLQLLYLFFVHTPGDGRRIHEEDARGEEGGIVKDTGARRIRDADQESARARPGLGAFGRLARERSVPDGERDLR